MITRRMLFMASAVILSGGWFLFDFFGNAAGYYSPDDQIARSVKVAPAEATKAPGNGGSKEVALASVNPLSGISLESLREIIERPLFNQSRAPKPKPQVEVVEAPAEPEATAEDFTLLGIVVANNGTTALLRWNKTNEIFRLKTGQSFSDWQVTEIGPKSVVIKNKELSFPLTLFSQPTQAAQPLAPNRDSNDDEEDQPEAVSRLEQVTRSISQ
jgi:hypothetical protein